MTARPLVLVRRPSARLADGELTHLHRQPVDGQVALQQWQGYVAAVRRAVEGLRESGRELTVVQVAITEFEKLEGCVTCLSVRVR